MDSTSMNYYRNNNFFKGKNIIVTGASGGIGSVVVKTLCELEAKVMAIVRNEKKFLSLFKNDINTSRLRYDIIDFSVSTNVNDIFQKIMFKMDGRLDSLIMCHSIYKCGNIENSALDDFDIPMTVNVRSCFGLLSLSTPFLKVSKGNCVIISSLEAKILTKGSFINSVTKSMLSSMIQCSALELASFGIRVNGVAPGITYTQHRVNSTEEFRENENHKFMEQVGTLNLLNQKVIFPQDVANTVLFLASSDANFITGEIIEIDNGYGLNHDTSFTDQTTDHPNDQSQGY